MASTVKVAMEFYELVQEIFEIVDWHRGLTAHCQLRVCMILTRWAEVKTQHHPHFAIPLFEQETKPDIMYPEWDGRDEKIWSADASPIAMKCDSLRTR